MDRFKPLPWQDELWKGMADLLIENCMPHALLIAGPSGIGKRHFVEALSAYMLCEEPRQFSCGRCRSCLQIQAGHHPNLMRLTRELDEKTGKQKRDIGIQDVRTLTGHLTLTSHYGKAKIAVIDPAEALNPSSANALLKTIEEPPPESYVLLLSESPQMLLPTLRSRCRHVRMAIPDVEMSLRWLGEAGDARMALEACHDAPLHAKTLMASGGLDRFRVWQEQLNGISEGRLNPLQFAASLMASKEKSRDDLSDFLRWFIGWLGEQLRRSVLEKSSGPNRRALVWESAIKEAMDAQKRLRGNGTPQLLLESLMVNWWRLNRQAKNV